VQDFSNLIMPIGGTDMLQRRDFGNKREQRPIAGTTQQADGAKTLTLSMYHSSTIHLRCVIFDKASKIGA
jgi:hypothetical protein